MGVMTAQPTLPFVAEPGAIPVGAAAALLEDADGGRVFIHGNLVHAWDAGEDGMRRLAAVQLVLTKAATAGDVAAAFGVGDVTLWRWRNQLAADGLPGLIEDKPGPKGPSRVTAEISAEIIRRRAAGQTFRSIAAAVGVSDGTVRRVFALQAPADTEHQRRREPAVRRTQRKPCPCCRPRQIGLRSVPPPAPV